MLVVSLVLENDLFVGDHVIGGHLSNVGVIRLSVDLKVRVQAHLSHDLELLTEELVQATQAKDALKVGFTLALDLDCLGILMGNDVILLGFGLLALTISLNQGKFGLSGTLCNQFSLEDLSLSTDGGSLELRLSLDLQSVSLGLFVDLGDGLLSLTLDNLEVSGDDGQLPGHVLVHLESLLCLDLLDDLKLLVVIENSHLVLLLGLLILVHRTVLSLLIEGLSNILRESDVLENDAGELKTLVGEHLVQELEHVTSLIFSLYLVDLEVGLATGEHTDALSDSRLNLLVELVDTDVVNEGFNRLFVFFALENSTDLNLDKDVVVSGTGLDVHLEDNVLLGHQVLDLGLY